MIGMAVGVLVLVDVYVGMAVSVKGGVVDVGVANSSDDGMLLKNRNAPKIRMTVPIVR